MEYCTITVFLLQALNKSLSGFSAQLSHISLCTYYYGIKSRRNLRSTWMIMISNLMRVSSSFIGLQCILVTILTSIASLAAFHWYIPREFDSSRTGTSCCLAVQTQVCWHGGSRSRSCCSSIDRWEANIWFRGRGRMIQVLSLLSRRSLHRRLSLQGRYCNLKVWR
jgi:hypothetical protein